ncbi:MAG TPA: hypothetical protein GX019_06045, partial [Firmicutes bacterium]|nr:hypothetical protein [Bacillota bacterium]
DLIIWAQDQGVPNNEMWAGYHSLNDIRKDADPILLKYLEKGIDEKKLSLLREIPRAIAALGITERFANTSVLTSKILSLLAESKGDDDNLYLTLIPCLCSMMYDIKVDQLPEIFNVLQWTRDSRLIWMLRELSLVGKFVPEIVSAFIRMLRNPEDYHSFIRPFLDDPRLDYRVIYSLLINLKHTRNTKFRYDLNVLANELQEGNRKIAGVSADSIKDILAL